MTRTLILRRGLLALPFALLALALISAPRALARPDCDLTPTAPICNPGDPGDGTGGGTGGGSTTPPSVFTTSRFDAVGDGQYMSTTTTVDRVAMTMNSTVHTWTTNWFWGFHGCVVFDLLDGAGNVITHSQRPCFGVDGTAIGMSDRTDSIQWHLHPAEAAAIRSVRIIQSAL
jgi:hypothetical protein